MKLLYFKKVNISLGNKKVKIKKWPPKKIKITLKKVFIAL